jgi:hypothetical protein
MNDALLFGGKFSRSRAFALPVLMVVLLVSGCGERETTRVHLHVQPPPGRDLLRLEIQAQVTGSQAGLRYKWFSVSGECEPQESLSPATTFKFAENIVRDRVSVEVWRGEKRVASSEVDVKLNEERLRLETERTQGFTVEITNVPPYEPYGGESTRSYIGGMARGKLVPGCKVIIYARVGDTWYVQPLGDSSTTVSSEGIWTNWTHTGSSYAALLVRPGYETYARLDILPPVGGYVTARTVVEGAKK